MALHAFDGTGQKDDQPDERDTNVARFFFRLSTDHTHLPIDDHPPHSVS